jgi:predicted nucleic acid-binding protein
MPVLDASVLVEYLAGGEHAQQARQRILAEPDVLWAPHLVDAEVGHVLRRAAAVGDLTAFRAKAALQALTKMPLQRAAHGPLLQRAWRLRDNLTFYDALYIALAEHLKMPLLTLDARTAAAPGVRASIDLIA